MAADMAALAPTRHGVLPRGFLWGASWAAYDVEGNCLNTDLWALEHATSAEPAELSGDAIDFYHRCTEDLKLLASLGLRTVRLSIEWSRIEPEPGRFSQAAIDHYATILKSCHGLNLSPIVVLHHLASPRWLQRLGGWREAAIVGLFQRYCAHVMSALGEWMPMVVPMFALNAAASQAALPWLPRGSFVDVGTPYWQASHERVQEVLAAARQTIGVLRPHAQVGTSWWVGAGTRLDDLTQADFHCLEYDQTEHLHRLLDRHPVSPLAWIPVDHGVAQAGASAQALTQATEGLLSTLHSGARLTAWLHGAAFDGWRTPGGLVSVDRRHRLARHISPAVRAWAARMTAMSRGELPRAPLTH